MVLCSISEDVLYFALSENSLIYLSKIGFLISSQGFECGALFTRQRHAPAGRTWRACMSPITIYLRMFIFFCSLQQPSQIAFFSYLSEIAKISPHLLFSAILKLQVMLPRGREMVDAQHVQAKYNITHPAQMRDLQALMGDAAVRKTPFFLFFFVFLCSFLLLHLHYYFAALPLYVGGGDSLPRARPSPSQQPYLFVIFQMLCFCRTTFPV